MRAIARAHRHGKPVEFEFDTVKEAAGFLYRGWEDTMHYPTELLDENLDAVWTHGKGIGDCSESIEKLRELAGIEDD